VEKGFAVFFKGIFNTITTLVLATIATCKIFTKPVNKSSFEKK
jgi:hypothetical protein